MCSKEMIVKNGANIFVPEFLDAQFFRRALEEGLREAKITISEVDFEWGSNPGENFCSSIYRVLVSFARSTSQEAEQERVSLIVKTINAVTQDTQFLEDAGVFIKELTTYYDVLPLLEVLVNDEQFGAKCYYTQREPMNIMVLQDLKPEGFNAASRQEGLDWDHSNLLVRKLGKFHATSMVLIKKDPKIISRFRSGMLSHETVKGSPMFLKLFGSALEQLIKVALKWDGFEHISTKLQSYLNSFEDVTSKMGQPMECDRFRVLNHGDMWTNNFLFAYDDASKPKVPTRAIFVDFQLTFYSSPACDINFFLNSCVQLDVLQNRRSELLDAYYRSLVETLQYLRYDKIPTFEDLTAELRQRELYGFFALYGILPVITMPKELSADNSIETLSDEKASREKFVKAFANEQLQQHLKYGLKRLDDLGVLDEF